MLSWFRRRKKLPQTDEEILVDAFAAIKKKQTRRVVRKRRAALWRKYADPRILGVLAAVFIIIVADGVRRENMEFYAVVAQATGPGQVRVAATEPVQTLEEGMRIQDGGRVLVGPGCWVTLNFPDGSMLVLAPGTDFTVELLEYHRGGMWRGRSFTLNFGRMWARISPKFGSQSRCRLHTPSSVAAVRGTQFYMAYDPSRQETEVACNNGVVRVDGFRGRPVMVGQKATTSVTYGEPPAGWRRLAPAVRATFAMAPLNQPIEPDPWLKTVELKLTSILDVPLSILGIGKSSWAVGAADYARRTAAMEALRRIHTAIEGYPSYPEFVDPFTLRELDFRPEDARQILRNFDGAAIEKYERVGQGFVIWARARDKARTPYKLTAYGVEAISEEEASRL